MPPAPGVADQAQAAPRSPHRGNSGAVVMPQSPLRIRQDGKFYERLLTKDKETSAANLSFRYYWAEPGAVPFVWESQPGTPKDVVWESPGHHAAAVLPAPPRQRRWWRRQAGGAPRPEERQAEAAVQAQADQGRLHRGHLPEAPPRQAVAAVGAAGQGVLLLQPLAVLIRGHGDCRRAHPPPPGRDRRRRQEAAAQGRAVQLPDPVAAALPRQLREPGRRRRHPRLGVAVERSPSGVVTPGKEGWKNQSQVRKVVCFGYERR